MGKNWWQHTGKTATPSLPVTTAAVRGLSDSLTKQAIVGIVSQTPSPVQRTTYAGDADTMDEFWDLKWDAVLRAICVCANNGEACMSQQPLREWLNQIPQTDRPNTG